MTDESYDDYEPSEEEMKEIEEVIKGSSKKYETIETLRNRLKTTRKIYEFASEDHWAGWLRTHGIRW